MKLNIPLGPLVRDSIFRGLTNVNFIVNMHVVIRTKDHYRYLLLLFKK